MEFGAYSRITDAFTECLVTSLGKIDMSHDGIVPYEYYRFSAQKNGFNASHSARFFHKQRVLSIMDCSFWR